MGARRLSIEDVAALDQPVWSSLASRHRDLARGGQFARRYPPEIAPFAAISEFSTGAINGLRNLASEGPIALLGSAMLGSLEGLEVQSRAILCQMISVDTAPGRTDFAPEILGADDVAAMLELTALTKPGPFSAQTYLLGRYIGIRDGDRLVAMAGERLGFPGFTELSAVCVHPEHRGKGYARILLHTLMREISASGEVAFLHVRDENRGAIELNERLGFVLRRTFHLSVMRRSDTAN